MYATDTEEKIDHFCFILTLICYTPELLFFCDG